MYSVPAWLRKVPGLPELFGRRREEFSYGTYLQSEYNSMIHLAVLEPHIDFAHYVPAPEGFLILVEYYIVIAAY